ncbi:MAG: cupin domain-containing protein [Gammaproteobacteria bacterium]|nr:cupin domain-containing protein [Gammaproteobacteria bacterium]
MSQSPLIHHAVASEYFFVEGCFIVECWNVRQDASVSVARARVEPGMTTHWHRLHGVTERYLILEGQGRVEVGALTPENVRSGTVVLIPPGFRQRIANTGDTDLIFLAICTPRFTSAIYEDLELKPD